MKSVKEVDARATFESMALPHTADLFRSAMSRLGDASQAELAVEECLVQSSRAADQYRPGMNCRPVLYRALLEIVSRRRSRCLLNFRKTLKRQPVNEDTLSALRLLPEQFAHVLLLADVHEFTSEEIQETLRISADTLASRLSGGRRKFADALSSSASLVTDSPWRDGLEEPGRLEAAQ